MPKITGSISALVSLSITQNNKFSTSLLLWNRISNIFIDFFFEKPVVNILLLKTSASSDLIDFIEMVEWHHTFGFLFNMLIYLFLDLFGIYCTTWSKLGFIFFLIYHPLEQPFHCLSFSNSSCRRHPQTSLLLPESLFWIWSLYLCSYVYLQRTCSQVNLSLWSSSLRGFLLANLIWIFHHNGLESSFIQTPQSDHSVKMSNHR